MDPQEIAQARAAVGDDEVVGFLSQELPAVAEYKKEGYSSKEILDTMMERPDLFSAPTAQQQEVKQKAQEAIAISETPLVEGGPTGGQIVAGLGAEIALSEAGRIAGTAIGAKIGGTAGTAGGPASPATVPVGAGTGATVGYVAGSLIGGASGSIAAQKIEGAEDINWGRVIADSLINLVPGAGELKSGPKALRAISRKVAQNRIKSTAAIGAVTAPVSQAATNLYATGDIGDADELLMSSAMGAAFGGGIGWTSKKGGDLLRRMAKKPVTELNRAVYAGDKDAVSFIDIVTKDVDPDKFLTTQDASSYLKNMEMFAKSRFAPSKVVGDKAAQSMRDASNITMAGREVGGILGTRVDKKISESADPAATNQLVAEFVTGKTKALPPELKDLQDDLSAARNYIKEEQNKLLAMHYSGEKPLPDLLRMKIEESVTDGSYLTRSYRFFDDPNWVPTEKMREKALQELQSEGMKLEDARAYLANLNAKRASNDEEILSVVYSADPKILRERKDISPAVREYLGEYVTPGEQITATMSALARRNAYAKADSEITQALQTSGLLKAATEEIPPNWGPIKLRTGPATTQGQELFGPPELQRAINELYASKVDNAIQDTATKTAADLWDTGIAVSKAVKVLGNPPAYLVQLYGNVSQLLGMGMNPFKGLKSGMRAAAGQFADMPVAQSGPMAKLGLDMPIKNLDEFKELKELGLVPSALQFADIQAGTQGKIGQKVQSVIDPLGKVYSIPDVALRVSAFKNYEGLLAKAAPSAPADKAKKVAAVYTNNTYPNYDYINSSLKTLSRKGVPLSQFASFTMEMLRTQYNQGQLIRRMVFTPDKLAKEMASELGVPVDKRVLQKEGLKRFAALAAMYGGVAFGIEQFNRKVGGVSEEKEQAHRRTSLAEWDENRPLLMRETKDGKIQSINASYLVPHMQMAAPALAAIRGESFGDAASKAVSAFAEDITGEGSFVMNAMSQALNNSSYKTKQQISSHPDGITKNIEIGSWFLKEVATPGISREIEKARVNPWETTALRQAGVRVNTTSPEEGFRYRTRALKESINMAQREIGFARNKMEKGEFTPEMFSQYYQKANESYKANMAKLVQHVKDLRTLGKSEDEIFKMMRDYGVGSERAIEAYDGIIEDLPAFKRETVADKYDELVAKVGKKDVTKEFYTVAKENQELAKALAEHHKRVMKDEKLNITQREKTLRSLSSTDGSRANHIFREMKRNPDKALSIKQEYMKKGIINASVYRQLTLLEQAEKKKAGQTQGNSNSFAPTR